MDVGPYPGVVLPGGQALFIEGEDDALAVHLGGGQPAQPSAGVGGHEGAARGVAVEAGQRPYLPKAVGEDDAADMGVQARPGLLLLAVEAETAAADGEVRCGFRESGRVEGVPLVTAQVDLLLLSGRLPVGGRRRGGASYLREELVDEVVRGVGVLLDHVAEDAGPGRAQRVEQVRPVAVSQDGLRHGPLGARSLSGRRDVQGRVDDGVVDVSGSALHVVYLLAAGHSRVPVLPWVAAGATSALGAEDVQQVAFGAAGLAARPQRSAPYREGLEP